MTGKFPVAGLNAWVEGRRESDKALDIAVVGSGISGLSAAWLLSKRHRVVLFEADGRLGGHSHTVDAAGVAVDTGFIVFNAATYPNLTAMLDHLGVATQQSDMSFAVSLDDGRLEYSGSGLSGLFAQGRNAISPRFWLMLRDLLRFYREAPRDIAALGAMTLDAYLDAAGYGEGFRNDHLYPMAAAIWSTPAAQIGAYPAASFIRFCETHGLLKLYARPAWMTVAGGSRAYVRVLADAIPEVVANSKIRTIMRSAKGVEIIGDDGHPRHFDQVVIATHADQALQLLGDPSSEEQRLLGSFDYISNEAVLHSDKHLMPRRPRVWSSWNYMTSGDGDGRKLAVTYWMNRLQNMRSEQPLFVTLNPHREIAQSAILKQMRYSHPRFDVRAMDAQQQLWSLQGSRNTWFCGAYFGAGFHEDGLQAGLAVAEALGGVRRPWSVPDESGRIHVNQAPWAPDLIEAA
ncbi:NAD(P)/FAD-dependent oxidoreductase [Chelatococcus asaccharovorans]|uniref:NAD(P)/FAD-dependent oxidoreductase n=1 Tax=Chelatococcus asaccharovorans TaxID=28210 RepID=UPI00224C7BC1|nr:Amine oxidase, flavin-containing [Chelatococcus asaccharovorans]CAH1679030.1 Amine oxidase, flavin-containing [Chelatococcus asaccharovorans]